MNELVLSQQGAIDFRHLNEVELDVIVQVIQKDFELKAFENARLRRHRQKLKEADERVSILVNSDFNENFCVICFKRFVAVFHPKQCCLSCWHCMCPDCSIWVPRDKMYLCLLCQTERTIKSMACDWYYNLLKDRFEHNASELVAQSLYSNKSQYSLKLLEPLVTPGLLEKVKGAQISRYIQKIQSTWEEMQERLRRLDLSEVDELKRAEGSRFIFDEYRTKFRDILKEFSQVLYITLENYSTGTEGAYININEQVLQTVHGVVENLVGYRINLFSDEMQSVISDVESTASMFVGNELEEKLAVALITKIYEDNRKVYSSNDVDLNFLENFQIRSDDQSSTTTYLYRASQTSGVEANQMNGSGRSSLIAFHTSTANKAGPVETKSDRTNSSFSDSTASSSNEYQDMAEVVLSAKKVQQILKSPSSSRSPLVDRQVKVPVGEHISLSVQLNGIRKTEVTWTKISSGKKVSLKNNITERISISSSNKKYGAISNLQISNSGLQDEGLYSAQTSGKLIASFMVKIIDEGHTPCKPSFRLKMMNSSVRTGQNAEFTVEATGNPRPNLVFYHNNSILDIPSAKYELINVPNISRVTLKINKAVPSDKGTYKCVASSDSGSCECSAMLQVTSLNFRFEKRDSTQSSNSSVDEEIYVPNVRIRPNSTDGSKRETVSFNQGLQKGQLLYSKKINGGRGSEVEDDEVNDHKEGNTGTDKVQTIGDGQGRTIITDGSLTRGKGGEASRNIESKNPQKKPLIVGLNLKVKVASEHSSKEGPVSLKVHEDPLLRTNKGHELANQSREDSKINCDYPDSKIDEEKNSNVHAGPSSKINVHKARIDSRIPGDSEDEVKVDLKVNEYPSSRINGNQSRIYSRSPGESQGSGEVEPSTKIEEEKPLKVQEDPSSKINENQSKADSKITVDYPNSTIDEEKTLNGHTNLTPRINGNQLTIGARIPGDNHDGIEVHPHTKSKEGLGLKVNEDPSSRIYGSQPSIDSMTPGDFSRRIDINPHPKTEEEVNEDQISGVKEDFMFKVPEAQIQENCNENLSNVHLPSPSDIGEVRVPKTKEEEEGKNETGDNVGALDRVHESTEEPHVESPDLANKGLEDDLLSPMVTKGERTLDSLGRGSVNGPPDQDSSGLTSPSNVEGPITSGEHQPLLSEAVLPDTKAITENTYSPEGVSSEREIHSVGDKNQKVRKDLDSLFLENQRPNAISFAADTEPSPKIPPRKSKTSTLPAKYESGHTPGVSPKSTTSKSMDPEICENTWSTARFSRVREIFNKSDMTVPFVRRESITRRTPPTSIERKEFRLTKEVRIRSATSTEDLQL